MQTNQPCPSKHLLQVALRVQEAMFLIPEPGTRETAPMLQSPWNCSDQGVQKPSALLTLGLPRWLSDKESTYQCRRCGIALWVWKIPWKRKYSSTRAWKSHGRRSRAGYSPWGRKERATVRDCACPACSPCSRHAFPGSPHESLPHAPTSLFCRRPVPELPCVALSGFLFLF